MRVAIITIALWAVPYVVLAENLPADAPVFDELIGVRSAGMGGAHRAVGTSNDTIYLNPAGMAIGRRYSVELNYGYSPFSKLTHLNISAVDSKTGPVAGALSYTHTRGDDEGVDAKLHRAYIAVAYPLSNAVALGMTARHIRGSFNDGDEQREISLYSGDVGFLARIGESVGLGVTAHNVIKEELARMMPLTFGVGVSYAGGPLVLAADLDIYPRDTDDTLRSYHVGGEYFLGGSFPLRLGYAHLPFTNKSGEFSSEHVLSAGLGWVSQTGALAAAFTRSLARERNWSLSASLQLFL